MDKLALDGGDIQLFFDGAVVDLFHSYFYKFFRTPAAWVGVRTELRKNSRLRVDFGRADARDGPIYGPDVRLSWSQVRFEVDAADDEPMRAFFAAVAGAAGR
jgi:hypothetical protein